MKILILGGKGMAGHLIDGFLTETTDWDLTSWGRSDFEVKEGSAWEDQITDLNRRGKLDFIINAIGILKPVANADPVLAMEINALFPHRLAEHAKRLNIKVIHLSTDCWLDLDVYGRSKRAGEIDCPEHLTVRMSIMGPELKSAGSGLFHWFMAQKGSVNGFVNHFWDGVTTLELARKIKSILEEDPGLNGIQEFRTDSKISKYELLSCIQKTFQKEITINKLETDAVDKTNPRADMKCPVPLDRQIQTMKRWMTDHAPQYRQYLC